MKQKSTVGIIFGGRSPEHEVSVKSAKNIYNAIDTEKFNPVLIKIDKSGLWYVGDSESGSVLPRDSEIEHIDVFFPVLHGPYGEDGTVQGLLELIGKPFVGSGVLASAVGMDKEVAKRLLIQAGLPVVKYRTIYKKDESLINYEELKLALGDTLFIKPANMGSSVGVRKVKTAEEFKLAVEDACTYDMKLLVEESINAREIECGVLGNESPEVSVVGEIVPHHEFYSYDAKYNDTNGASLIIPAKLTPSKTEEIRELTKHVFTTLQCAGLARVDFFLEKETDTVYVNEINTMPGFTDISMYPKLWASSGTTYADLITKLIGLARERHETETTT